MSIQPRTIFAGAAFHLALASVALAGDQKAAAKPAPAPTAIDTAQVQAAAANAAKVISRAAASAKLPTVQPVAVGKAPGAAAGGKAPDKAEAAKQAGQDKAEAAKGAEHGKSEGKASASAQPAASGARAAPHASGKGNQELAAAREVVATLDDEPADLKQKLEKRRDNRKARRKAAVAGMRARWGKALESRAAQAELMVHARRVAQLQRIQEVATHAGKTKLVERTVTLMAKETERHDKRMDALARGAKP